MKRWLMLVVVLVGLSAAGTAVVQYLPGRNAGGPEVPILSGAAENPNGPKAKVAFAGGGGLLFDVGNVPQKTSHKHTWTIKNEGQGDLELFMKSSTCSCTFAAFKDGNKAVVKPGQTTEIDLEFDTKTFENDHVWGAEIATNDPDKPSFSLQAKGKVFPALQTFPPDPVASLGNISNDQDDHVIRFAVYSKDRPETKIVKINGSNPNIVMTHKPMTAEELKGLPEKVIDQAEMVAINVKGTLALGPFREEIVVTTDHPKQPEIRLGVTGKMIGPVNVQPGVLIMHDVYGKAGGTGEINVVVRNKRPTKVEIVKKPEALKAEILPALNGVEGRYRLVVTIPAGTPAQKIEEAIVLKTDHPKAGELSVPLSIWVLSPN